MYAIPVGTDRRKKTESANLKYLTSLSTNQSMSSKSACIKISPNFSKSPKFLTTWLRAPGRSGT